MIERTVEANYRPGIVLIAMETSGELRRRFQEQGFETYSCDLLPSQDGGEDMTYSADGIPLGRHMVGDVFHFLDYLWVNDMWPEVAIFHPECTYLTNSAEWAFSDPDFQRYPGVGYHQKVKPETLVGADRRAARETALEQVRQIFHLNIRVKAIENPRGAIGSKVRKASQIVQPYQFGDDASKATCFWFCSKDAEELPIRLEIDPAKRAPGRPVPFEKAMGRPRKEGDPEFIERWSNQTGTGHNNVTPSADRWQGRSNTYPGIADALVKAITSNLDERLANA